MLGKVRFALRVTSEAFNAEIQALIDDCLQELTMLGIYRDGLEDDPQILTAVIAYCKWRFGFTDETEKWERIYHDKVSKLIAATGYGMVEADG